MRHARLLILAAGLLYCSYVGYVIYQVKQIRHHPQRLRAEAIELFKGGSPHKILARWLLLYPGSRSYRLNVRALAYSSRGIEQNLWNRWILEKDNTSEPDLDVLLVTLPSYPLTPSDALIPTIRRCLSRSSEPHLFLRLFLRIGSRQATDAFRDWMRLPPGLTQTVKTLFAV